MKNTDIEELKSFSKKFFDMGHREPDEKFGMFMSHTYTNSTACFSQKKQQMLNLLDDEDFAQWRAEVFEAIDRQSKIVGLYMMINDPYKLLWVYMAAYCMSEKDIAEYWADAWVRSENPNQDVNVPLENAVEAFKMSDEKHLMTKEDYKVFKAIPETITLYRGVMKGHAVDGLSYTADKKNAIWFALRHNKGDSKLIEITVPKDYVLAYFNTRDEDEYVVDVPRLKEEGRFNLDEIMTDCSEEDYYE